MRAAVVGLVLLAIGVGSASAREWHSPKAAATITGRSDLVVAADGLTLATTHDLNSSQTEFRVGRHSAFVRTPNDGYVAAGGGDLVAVWDDGTKVYAMDADVDGFKRRTVLGAGQTAALAANRAGDMVVVLRQGRRLVAALRPAGQSFSAVRSLGAMPATSSVGPAEVAAAIDPSGTVTVIAVGDDVRAVTRSRSGGLSAIRTLADFQPPAPFESGRLAAYTDPQVVVDGAGRTAVFWGMQSTGGGDYRLVSAPSGPGGWGPTGPAGTSDGLASGYDVEATDDGNLLLAIERCCSQPREVELTESTLGDPFGSLGQISLLGVDPIIAMSNSGVAVVATRNSGVSAIRRDSAGEVFGEAEPVPCSQTPIAAGIDAEGTALLGVSGTDFLLRVTRDSAQPSAEAAPSCDRPPIVQLRGGPRRVRAKRRERLSFVAAIDPAAQLESVAWDFTGDGRFEQRTAAPSIDHRFRRPGRFSFRIRLAVRAQSGALGTYQFEHALRVRPSRETHRRGTFRP